MSGASSGPPPGDSAQSPRPGTPFNLRRWITIAFIAGLIFGFILTLGYLVLR